MTFLVEVPLPPQGVQQNNRRHWRATASATKKYREDCASAAKFAMSFKEFKGFTVPVEISADFFMALTPQERKLKDAVAAARKEGKKVPAPKPVHYRPRDIGNAVGALKAAIDGLKDAGMFADDDHKHVDLGKIRLRFKPYEHGGRSGVLLAVTAKEGV